MSNKAFVHFKGNEDFISRIDDYVDQVEDYRKVFTPFLTPLEQSILTSYVGKKVVVAFDGGYENSENKRCLLSQEPMVIPFPIVCLKADYQIKFHTIDHRDVLGSIMNLGINRNQFGDIVVEKGHIYIFVAKEIEAYIRLELRRIKQCSLTFEPCYEEIVFEPELEYEYKNVSSFRLDVLVATITHLSREKAKKLIQDGKIKVNHLPLEDCAYICHNDCILSIRGYGRFQVHDLGKRTRSNRLCIEIGKYK
ncbi:RNA-binding protein YlmH [Breznakia sp. PF5-3]|uniref:YlmH family RNA-binding protein n=1 Tax=unclassified Breznakia TaxID=2623764 RepID=UPI0024074C70|nr:MULTISPECIES: YlmH/Sll1252 family protein [unclassified Breznakia]MDL2276443.1 YlmH/Sll1252 family protein [Breznakia sp. OttesenSCG-928-G09]MDF9825032.1 RNA-binding protein YlmH [Breznakia sp. PM6-1]MDF9835397.1 RNA-binding protein YlmH [Breznakia sp. PF5-3]MDF9837629.1 RNA-binding protein YlmH [Breznakia sp. PFB2-8]MDF9859493.1 RNA-binding protein YlmH [Breznakia sp. PH5-24]